MAMCHLLTGLFAFPFERPPSPRSHHAVHNLVKKSRTQPGFKDCKEFSHWQNWHHTVLNLVKKSRTQPINKDFKELSQWHHPVHNLVYKDGTVLSRYCHVSRKQRQNFSQAVPNSFGG